MAMQILPVGLKLGAEVRGVDASKPIGESEQAALRNALSDNLVLLFRKQTLAVDDHIRFAQTFGKLGAIADTLLGMGKRKNLPDDIPECVSVISNIKVGGQSIGSLGDGECLWHTDSSFAETPPSASVLYSVEVPSEGGNTAFLNMFDALESLPTDLRKRIDGLKIRHSEVYDSNGNKRPQYADVKDVSQAPGPDHPIVRTIPETGRKVLFLGRRKSAYVVGLSVAESEALLDELWARTVSDHRVWSHSWQVGDIIVWDNRITMHHRDPFDPNARRRMHKVQISGERPV